MTAAISGAGDPKTGAAVESKAARAAGSGEQSVGLDGTDRDRIDRQCRQPPARYARPAWGGGGRVVRLPDAAIDRPHIDEIRVGPTRGDGVYGSCYGVI